MPDNEQYDNGTEVVLGQPAQPAEGVTGPRDMRPDRSATYDRDVAATHDSELQQEREARRERLGHQVPGSTPATTQPVEPDTYDDTADQDADERVADYNTEETQDGQSGARNEQTR